MKKNDHNKPTAFGTVLGVASGDVKSYSSDYDTADGVVYPNRASYRSYYDGIYMGYKWQCVEFARRWLYVNKGYIFDDVAMAYEIFDLRTVREIQTNKTLPLKAFKNGSARHPEEGCLLIWEEGGAFERTGHVAIVTEVTNQYVRIIEQNMDFCLWPENKNYSREIKSKIGADGDYWLECSFEDSIILGWVIQTDDIKHSEILPEKNTDLFKIKNITIGETKNSFKPWLNIANPDEEAYVNAMGGHFLSSVKEDHLRYYMISESAYEKLKSATDELHNMFTHATDYVFQHPKLLEKFGLPASIIPRIQKSWNNRQSQLITSRFDFALSEKGLKVYEYNCDSASCYMEAGKIQGKWARHLGVTDGIDAAKGLFRDLVEAWRDCEVTDIIHVLQDHDAEEDYHALFMKTAIEAAGYECVRIVGLESLKWNKEGIIVDEQENPVKWVWKTWAWETAIDQLRAETDHADLLHANSEQEGKTPRLADVLLREEIKVFEPLWTLIPSNKAILPVLWKLFPNHPLLLNTSYELNDDLIKTGYVIKPIVGRCGANIQLIDKNKNILANKEGNFFEREQIYQQLFALPKIENYYVQISTFTSAGSYAGAATRVDTDMIIGKDSDCIALRIEDDVNFLKIK